MLIHVLMFVSFAIPMFLPNIGTVAVFLMLCLGAAAFFWPSFPAAASEQAGPLLTKILIGLTVFAAMSGGFLRAMFLWVEHFRIR